MLIPCSPVALVPAGNAGGLTQGPAAARELATSPLHVQPRARVVCARAAGSAASRPIEKAKEARAQVIFGVELLGETQRQRKCTGDV